MRAVRLLLCGTGLLALAGCGSGTPAPPAHTVTVTPSSSAPASSSLSSGPPSSRLPARVFDARTMESSVRKLLLDTYKIANVGAVSCPPAQPVADGTKFQCTVDIAGAQKHVPIAVTGAAGEYKVDPPR